VNENAFELDDELDPPQSMRKISGITDNKNTIIISFFMEKNYEAF